MQQQLISHFDQSSSYSMSSYTNQENPYYDPQYLENLNMYNECVPPHFNGFHYINFIYIFLAYYQYPRKIQKIKENSLINQKEIFSASLGKESFKNFQGSHIQKEITIALFEQQKLFASVFQKSKENEKKMHEIKGDISDLKYFPFVFFRLKPQRKKLFHVRPIEEKPNSLSQLQIHECKESLILKTLKFKEIFNYELALYSEMQSTLIRERLFRSAAFFYLDTYNKYFIVSEFF